MTSIRYWLATFTTVLALTPAQAQIEVTYWHSMGGFLGNAISALVDEYNASQDNVMVTPVYVGTYDDGINQLQAGLQSGNVPHLIQVYDIGTRTLADIAQMAPDIVVPLQTLLERDGIDPDIFIDTPTRYYTVDGQLYSVPFNASNPLMYFNADLFREAGLDPANPPTTIEALDEALELLTVRDGAGNTERYGLVVDINSWFIEQLLYNRGSYYCNNENGRAGRATEVLWDSEEGRDIVRWWVDNVERGVMANVGRDNNAARQLFLAGQAAIYWSSSASMTVISSGVGDNFEMATAFMPYPEETGRNGVAVGGASLWLLGNHSDEEIEATWDFVRWLITPEVQAQWHMTTGYFPVTAASFDLPEVQAFHQENPAFLTAIAQLEASQANNASAGCLMGGFPEVRGHLVSAMEDIVNGNIALEEGLARAAERANEAVARFNRLAAE